jgi:basic amino acid/polyamine antiporter, APA family
VSADPPAAPALRQALGLRDAVALVLGAVIGSAIFLVPSSILAGNRSPAAAMALFVAGGLLSWVGALAYAELGGMFPRTGGEYVFLRESWGRFAAFLCGWSHFLVVQTAGIAALAVGFASLLSSLVPLPPAAGTLAAPGLIVVLTVLNYRGVRTGIWAGNLFTAAKVAGLVLMLAAVAAQGEPVAVDWSWPAQWTFAQMAAGIVPVLWAYEGWNLVTFVAGEMRNPKRDVPLALGGGLLVVLCVYALSVWVYLRVMTVPEIVASPAVAPEAAMRVAGAAGGRFVTLTMIFAVVGATNAAVLAAPRLYWSQAMDGLFFGRFAHLHPVFRTPSHGLVVQCVWASALSSTGSYEMLLSSCIFVAWIFYGLCAAAVALLRFRSPGLARPYRMWGAPWTPALFAATAAAVVAGSFIARPLPSLAGLALMSAGIPFYLRWRRGVPQ